MQLLRSRKVVAVFGISTLFVSLIGLFMYPSQAALSEGFRTPVIAFEFAQSTEDLKFLTGNEEVTKKLRSEMRVGQKLDIFFPFLYAGFMFFLVFSEIKKINPFTWLGFVISIIIVPCDLYENYIMDQILFRLDRLEDFRDLLSHLEVATWWKWGAIAIVMFVLSSIYFSTKQWFNGMISFFPGVAIFCTWISGSNGYVAEVMMIFVSFFFIYFGIRSFILYRKFETT
ncbi:hypothetical protein [Leptospira perdikensis]|uniref:Uncharacterized protein n=1 Tax=Leptospira perdikensis TaxID=2484948 RepID=A0A4V6QLX5_9LEPT|nr:hypothetical protein [Leptospira perdikensis]TGL40376.1 hypothetical protein EHQ49_09990 [Leptospira perdikensis]